MHHPKRGKLKQSRSYEYISSSDCCPLQGKICSEHLSDFSFCSAFVFYLVDVHHVHFSFSVFEYLEKISLCLGNQSYYCPASRKTHMNLKERGLLAFKETGRLSKRASSVEKSVKMCFLSSLISVIRDKYFERLISTIQICIS